MSLAQINASLQAALSSVGYATNTTIPQVKQELTALHTNLAVVPQGITTAASAARTTSIIKGLSSPVTQEEGIYLVTTLQNLNTVILNLVAAGNARILAVEAIIPGLSKLGLTTLRNLIDALAQALIAAVPSPDNKSVIQGIQSSLDAAIQSSLARVPA